MNIRARVIFAIILFTLCLIAWWLSGFDFNHRGDDAVTCFLTSIATFAAGVSCPLFDK